MTIVLAAAHRTNAELIEDCVRLGYLHRDQRIVDLTYGRGAWWKRWRPDALEILAGDFTATGYADESFDVVCFDPPYCPPGGRSTSTIKQSLERYGQVDMPKTPAATQELIDAGLTESARVVRDAGLILAKCKSYITSGEYQHQEYATTRHAVEKLGLVVHDRLLVVQRRPGPQSQTTQKHARNNYSTLLVFRR